MEELAYSRALLKQQLASTAFSAVSVVKLSSRNFRERIYTARPRIHTDAHVYARNARLSLCKRRATLVSLSLSLYESDESRWLESERASARAHELYRARR